MALDPMYGIVFSAHAHLFQIRSYLQLWHESIKHGRHVNGLIKLERNIWICDKADRLDQAFQSGDMHAMYLQLGALTKYAKSNTSAAKVCRVSDADGVPTQSYSEEKLAFRAHFSKTVSAKTLIYSEVIQKDRDESNITGYLDRYSGVMPDNLHTQIPSPSEVVSMHSMSKKGKAPGEDFCSGNVLSFFIGSHAYLLSAHP